MASKNGRDALKRLGKGKKYLGSIYLLKFLITIIIISSVKSVY